MLQINPGSMPSAGSPFLLFEAAWDRAYKFVAILINVKLGVLFVLKNICVVGVWLGPSTPGPMQIVFPFRVVVELNQSQTVNDYPRSTGANAVERQYGIGWINHCGGVEDSTGIG
ncbi:hypothetical protein [Stieleria neptunia]|uniref:hypothetical protein n=1 Tax=Stieleria neptunia TaxID=2527979 RepID=UPI0011AA0083|nr:hypothetical protein [Stieleria neptunia]